MNSLPNPQPERMDHFFNARHASYDEHMRRTVASFNDFYETIAASLPYTAEKLKILDLGCGTGLEFESILRRVPNAQITGIDVSTKMLDQLRQKYTSRLNQISIIEGSYLAIDLGEAVYDYVVSVMTLHHLLPKEKLALYNHLHKATRPGGKYIEGDYVVDQEQAQRLLFSYEEKTQQVTDAHFGGGYHIDIPLTVDNQQELLLEAGFRQFDILWHVGEAAVYVATV